MRKTSAKKKKVIPKLEDDASDKPSPSGQPDVPDELETEKFIRKSTRTSVIVRQAEREAIRAEKEATVKVCDLSASCIKCCNCIALLNTHGQACGIFWDLHVDLCFTLFYTMLAGKEEKRGRREAYDTRGDAFGSS